MILFFEGFQPQNVLSFFVFSTMKQSSLLMAKITTDVSSVLTRNSKL